MQLSKVFRRYGAFSLRSIPRPAGPPQHHGTYSSLTACFHLPSDSCETTPTLLSASLPKRWLSNVSEARKEPKDAEIQDHEALQLGKDETKKSKKTRSGDRKTSLRRVAVEAQQSRDKLILGDRKLRFVNPDVETKTVTAFCAAEQYSIEDVAATLRRAHFKVDPLDTGLFPQVVHIRTLEDKIYTYAMQKPPDADEATGDVFIFPSGTMVAWNVPAQTTQYLLDLIHPLAKGPHSDTMETEDLDYFEDANQLKSRIIGDTIILGTKADASDNGTHERHHVEGRQHSVDSGIVGERPSVDMALAKIAFSSGFARSTKLAVLESRLNNFVASTRQIPHELSAINASFLLTNKRHSRKFMLEKTGELLNLRAQLNLYSELTDSLPDLFWDSRHELGLEGYYDMVGQSLDVGQRIKVLNEKMDYAQEITTVLRETLNEKHGELLEWLIIWLIAIEVIFELPRVFWEWRERWGADSTDSLLRQYLEHELQKTS
ncbi:MAG: hypothetical protein M1820_010689 [Bogoriella megaspora]|nr:MAG: hypothetical protein M1820_010689 [Bogoriella megaspora]